MSHSVIIIIDKTKSLAEVIADANDKARLVDTELINNLYSGNESKAHDDLETYQDVLEEAFDAVEAAAQDIMNL